MGSMTTSTARAFGRICRDRRLELDVTQASIAGAIGTSRGHYSMIEAGRVNVSAATMDRIAEALGIRLRVASTNVVAAMSQRPRDAVHALCVAYVARRLRAAGWEVVRELEITDGRLHGWIDLVAFDPVTRTLLVVEVKTRIDDVGRLERQIGWYERAVLRSLPSEWVPAGVGTWVLALASAEVDEAVGDHRAAFADALPGRAQEMRAVVARGTRIWVFRGFALIDPRSRRRDWLIPTRVDGRRTVLPYQDLARAASLLGT
jgi:transcriptional regulator with XRE-family HTH domain